MWLNLHNQVWRLYFMKGQELEGCYLKGKERRLTPQTLQGCYFTVRKIGNEVEENIL